MTARSLLAFLFIQLVAQPALANPQSEALFKKGQEAFENQRYRDSMRCYKRASRIDPADPKIYESLADVDLILDDLDSSIRDATTALSINPKMPFALTIRAKAYFAKNHLEACMSDLNKAIGSDPKYWEAYAMRSKLQCERKQWQPALLDCTKALDLRIKRDGANVSTSLYGDRGIILSRLNKWPAAIEDYTRAIRCEDDPNRLNRLYKDRATCYEKIGRHDLAAKDIQRCNKSTRADWEMILPN